ncbi:hypothetical protein HPQ64_15650 [Rhizobiales bacterium]|uniref:hypothetical protein n=1 Tax=Hongsoonwoonella zoysiae TaxID=2821844 RepID=UPI00156153DA|nr:hypothetical protein [Hongsoonwoonella zoysiae]NRG19126.1 hypothetical protein [Hongsoonwoonella zoysiae]
MPGYTKKLAIFLGCSAFIIAAPVFALADCAEDIDKVERALGQAGDSGIDETTADTMRQLLDQANEQRRDGNEEQCQELINQAKQMGNVE